MPIILLVAPTLSSVTYPYLGNAGLHSIFLSLWLLIVCGLGGWGTNIIMQCVVSSEGGGGRGGHPHLQIGRMLDIDLISEPPHAPFPWCMFPKCGNLCGQRGRKRVIASWGLRMSHICPCNPCPSPKGIGQRLKVVILPTTGERHQERRKDGRQKILQKREE